ncbi:MAG: hypothetical protein DME25_22075 [Verrucomicrobia bacterium]|nr:MAG: hypothetical protein DME25_22075 [Verrucomicrobiota bacterium]
MKILIIQILIVSFVVYALTRTVLRFRRGTISLGELALWSCFWIAGGVCVLAPGITQWFAGILGVGRGADAVFYLGLVGLSYAFFRLYLRIRHAEQQLTLLVRQLALKEAERQDRA